MRLPRCAAGSCAAEFSRSHCAVDWRHSKSMSALRKRGWGICKYTNRYSSVEIRFSSVCRLQGLGPKCPKSSSSGCAQGPSSSCVRSRTASGRASIRRTQNPWAENGLRATQHTSAPKPLGSNRPDRHQEKEGWLTRLLSVGVALPDTFFLFESMTRALFNIKTLL